MWDFFPHPLWEFFPHPSGKFSRTPVLSVTGRQLLDKVCFRLAEIVVT